MAILFAIMFGLMSAGTTFLVFWVIRLDDAVDRHTEVIYKLRSDVRRLLLEQPE